MKRVTGGVLACLLAVVARATPPGQYRLTVRPEMVSASDPRADFSGLVDEQHEVGDPPSGEPATGWKMPSQHQAAFPLRAVIDLGRETPLATLWLYDMNNTGDVVIHTGSPAGWSRVATYDCKRYKSWAQVPLGAVSRYLMLEVKTPGALFNEVVLDAYSERGWQAVAAAQAEAARREAERQAALARAREEALKRPLTELAPYGRLSLVDEVDCGAAEPGHALRCVPEGAARVETLLGRACRTLPPTSKACAAMTFRLGARKLLRPGAAYVLAVDYPEDAPRGMIIINTGNETSRGLHTGLATGDALHAKYVDSQAESLKLPLSGKWETWSLLFRLHDRFAEKGLVRGSSRPRALTPEDGFDVTVAQFSAENDPFSRGAAVASIRLYEVVDEDRLALAVNFPPEGLPRRLLFWREEMADGVIEGKKPQDRGVDEPLEWYRHKAELMRFLGMNTYAKDLLEFGACQHWDPTEHGGNAWVYFNSENKGLWGRIVTLMGQYGFDVLPYYEYSGSKGQQGLGNQRRAQPLKGEGPYSHITWIESANADLTDPDTLADFQKMLDLTVVKYQEQARFAGVWLRPRAQMPVGFGDRTRARFAQEANQGAAVTREQLKADKALYGRYLAWWEGKRRDFLTALRDYLRGKGVKDAFVLYTGCSGEPGKGFGDFQPRFFTDAPDLWAPVLAQEAHQPPLNRQWQVLTPAAVAEGDHYLRALLAPGATWGAWELQHSNPADDPAAYRQVEGVLLSHPFNRLYTVSSPKTFDLYRTPAGLALMRHYALNENMMSDAADKELLGYFVADVERAGPACMQAEAVAMAHGDPTMIGYLAGNNFGRGFPLYVRDFNANFLALPALPSRLLAGACAEAAVVARAIDAGSHGTYLSVVNTAPTPLRGVRVKVPPGAVTALASGAALPRAGEAVTLDLRPYQVLALRVR